MYIYILILFLLIVPIFLFFMYYSPEENNNYDNIDLILEDRHVGEIINLTNFNDKNIIMKNLSKKGKIKLISRGEDLVKFFFKGRYSIEETGNICSKEIQCEAGMMDIKPEKIKGGDIEKDVSLLMSNFEVMINNFEDVPRVDVKAFNIDNLIIN